MKPLSPLVQSVFINFLFLFSTFANKIWMIFTNFFFKYKYLTHKFQIFILSKIVIYFLLESKNNLYNPYKLINISSSFFFHITLISLLKIYKLCMLLKSLFIILLVVNTSLVNGFRGFFIIKASFLDFKYSKLLYIFLELYFALKSPMLIINLDIIIIFILRACFIW